MKENINENSVQNTDNNLENLANNLLKNPNSLDFGSLIQMATTLLKNDSLMNSVTELSKKNQSPAHTESNITEKRKKVTNDNSVQNTDKNVARDSLDLNSIMKQLATTMKNESLLDSVTELSKKNLNATLPVSKVSEKQENVELTSLAEKMEIMANDISGLRQESAEPASLSQKLENITNDILELKKELKDVKGQNSDIIKLLKKILKNNKK
jgi:urease gamma subunit